MRVLHVIQELGTGGAERVLLSVAKAVASADGEVAVAAAPGPLEGEFPGTVFPLPLIERRPWRVAAAARAVARAVRAFRPDLVHAHNPAVALAAATVTRRGARPPGLVTVQGVPDEDYGATARLLRLAGLPVVACGPGVTAALAERGLEVRATIPNSVSPPPPPAERATLAAEWDVPPDHRLVVAVGRLVAQKNHALAIRALAAVPQATLAIVGDGPLRGELEQEAALAGVRERVVFAGIRPDARSIMRAADAVVLSSRWEGLPLAGLEALAGETPLVATAVRGVREVLADAALLVPEDDSDALGEALRRVLDDPSTRERLTAAGLQLADRYTEEAMVDDYLDLYRSLIR